MKSCPMRSSWQKKLRLKLLCFAKDISLETKMTVLQRIFSVKFNPGFHKHLRLNLTVPSQIARASNPYNDYARFQTVKLPARFHRRSDSLF